MFQVNRKDDQRTIKKQFQNWPKKQLRSNSSNCLEQFNLPCQKIIHKPSIQMSTQTKYNSSNSTLQDISFLKHQQKTIDLQKTNLVQANSVNQKNNFREQQVSKCCIRLFTFMESTQKEKLNEENKENIQQNNLKMPIQNYIQGVKVDFSNHLNTNIAKSARSLKKINQNLNSRNFQQQSQIDKQQQIGLISFIEGSRKKREQLLNKLEQLEIDNFENIDLGNLSYLTPQENPIKPSNKISRPQSSRNFVESKQKNIKYFKKQNICNNNQSPRVIMKESLRKRHFSQLPLKHKKDQGKTPTINRIYLTRLKDISNRNSMRSITNEKQKNQIECVPRTKFLKQKQKLNNLTKNRSSSKKSLKNNDYQSNNKSSRRQNFCNNDNKKRYIKQNEKNKQIDMQSLIQRKNQLEKQLTNINDQIILFNKKKKKNVKSHFK